MQPVLPPRRTPSKIHCGHCKEEGHNINSCNLFQIKFHISLLTQDDSILAPGRYRYTIKHVYANLLTDCKLLFNDKISQIMHNNYSITYDNQLCEFTIIEQPVTDIKTTKNYTISGNVTRGEYYLDITTRLKYSKNLNYIKFGDLYDIVNNDYVEVVDRIKTERAADRARWQAQYEAQRQQRAEQIIVENAAHNNMINRVALPVLVNDAYDIDECPICLETLGDTNKTVLRCGHPLCTPCLLTMTLRSAANRNTNSCICSVCRTAFL